MATLKYGAIVVEIKGKVGGTIFQGGRSGGIMKNKGLGGNSFAKRFGGSGSDESHNAILNFAAVTKAWAGLTGPERVAYEALIGVWTFTNPFGDVYNGTAFQIFTSVNINRLSIEQPILSVAPIKVDAEDPNWSIADLEVSGTWELTRTLTPAVEQTVLVQMSAPQNETKNLGSILFKKAGVVLFSTSGTTNMRAQFNNLFGYDPPLGSYVHLRIWTCVAAYPRQQFLTTLKSLVVA